MVSTKHVRGIPKHVWGSTKHGWVRWRATKEERASEPETTAVLASVGAVEDWGSRYCTNVSELDMWVPGEQRVELLTVMVKGPDAVVAVDHEVLGLEVRLLEDRGVEAHLVRRRIPVQHPRVGKVRLAVPRVVGPDMYKPGTASDCRPQSAPTSTG